MALYLILGEFITPTGATGQSDWVVDAATEAQAHEMIVKAMADDRRRPTKLSVIGIFDQATKPASSLFDGVGTVIAIRENEELAKSTGIYSFRYYILAFTMATALAGLAGGLYAHYLGIVNPVLLGVEYIVMMLVMVIIGGTGTIGGPILGSFIYVFVLEWLPTGRQISLVIFGVIVLLCVIFMPRGIYPYLDSFFKRFTVQKSNKES